MSRFFGDTPVLRQVSFEAPGGRLFSLLGGNGAGKSTLLRILAGSLRPSSGEAILDGHPVGSVAARRQTGFLSHHSLLHPVLTVGENLRFYAILFALPRPAVAVDRALDLVRGSGLALRRVGELSQGMKQKAALARCLLHQPRLLLLDEPFASLDQAAVAEMRSTLAGLRGAGLALIVSSHQAEAIAGLPDAALTLDRGRLLSRQLASATSSAGAPCPPSKPGHRATNGSDPANSGEPPRPRSGSAS